MSAIKVCAACEIAMVEWFDNDSSATANDAALPNRPLPLPGERAPDVLSFSRRTAIAAPPVHFPGEAITRTVFSLVSF
jgi:hypothetical protein